MLSVLGDSLATSIQASNYADIRIFIISITEVSYVTKNLRYSFFLLVNYTNICFPPPLPSPHLALPPSNPTPSIPSSFTHSSPCSTPLLHPSPLLPPPPQLLTLLCTILHLLSRMDKTSLLKFTVSVYWLSALWSKFQSAMKVPVLPTPALFGVGEIDNICNYCVTYHVCICNVPEHVPAMYQNTYLQCTSIRESSFGASLTTLVLTAETKSSSNAGSFVAPKSGQAVKWNCFMTLERRCCVKYKRVLITHTINPIPHDLFARKLLI